MVESDAIDNPKPPKIPHFHVPLTILTVLLTDFALGRYRPYRGREVRIRRRNRRRRGGSGDGRILVEQLNDGTLVSCMVWLTSPCQTNGCACQMFQL